MAQMKNLIGAGISSRRRASLKVCFLALLLLLVAAFWPAPTSADDENPPHIALYLIIDSSGSMAGSDKSNLRWTAVRLLVSLLDEGDQIAVLSFSSSDSGLPEDAVRLFRGSDEQDGPLIRIGPEIDKQTLLTDLEGFAAQNPPNNNTDMLAAFKMVEPLVRQARSDSQPYIIFLTDGLPVALGWQADSSEVGLVYEDALLQRIQKINVPLYAGGLWGQGTCPDSTEQTPPGQLLLQQMSNMAPEGQAQCIDGAAQLPTFFLDSFGRLSDRHYQRSDANGAFEVRQDQEGLIQRLTLIYVADEQDCRQNGQSAPCIRDPSGDELTLAELQQRPDIETWAGEGFVVASIANPKAGTWLVDTENVHIILQTGLRMEITAPDVGVSRQPSGQPLPVRVHFFQELADGTEVALPEGYEPRFVTQTVLPSLEEAEPLTLNLIHNPTDETYEADTLPLEQEGTYLINVEAEVGGFRVVQEHRVQVDQFPQLEVDGLTSQEKISLPRGQQAEINVVARLNGQIQPITGLVADQVELKCEGRSTDATLDEVTAGTYKLAFTPPQGQNSQCELAIDGKVQHLGTPYYLSFGPQAFALELLPELHLEMQNNQDLGEVLQFENLRITGLTATLFADESARIEAHLGDELPLEVSLNQNLIVPKEETALTFTLTPQANAQLEYGVHEGVIVLSSPSNVVLSGPKELRYTFELIPPSVVHDVEGGYSLAESVPTNKDDAGSISFRLLPSMPVTGTLSVTLTDEQDQPLRGVTPELNTTVIPMDKEQTYFVDLQYTGDGDPWPADWLEPQPIAFNVRLDAGPEVEIGPTASFQVTGTRRSRLSTWWMQSAGIRALLTQMALISGLGMAGIWVLFMLGWMGLTRFQYVKPTGYLALVHLKEDGKTVASQTRKRSLSGYNKLKHRLFGVGIRLGVVSGGRGAPFRLFPASAFWYWLLGANKSDYSYRKAKINTEVRLLAERGGGDSNEPMYRLENLGANSLEVLRARDKKVQKVRQAEDSNLEWDDIILIGEQKGLQLISRSPNRVQKKRPHSKRPRSKNTAS